MNSSEERIPGLGMAVAAEQMQTDEVFRLHAARLYPVAFRLTGNASDAEDLVQETFAKAFAAAGWFQLGTNLSAWLHCIMMSAFITSYVNGQVAVPAGGQLKVPTPRVDQVLFRVVPFLALASRMR